MIIVQGVTLKCKDIPSLFRGMTSDWDKEKDPEAGELPEFNEGPSLLNYS